MNTKVIALKSFRRYHLGLNRHLTALLLLCIVAAAKGSEEASVINPGLVLSSVHVTEVYQFEKTARAHGEQVKHLISELLKIFLDQNSSNLSRCASAYYLGELRSVEAADPLSKEIGLQLDLTRYKTKDLSIVAGNPVADALLKIGNPAIPFLIRNLENSDDPSTRRLSLETLCKIDMDKAVLLLRFQKTLEKQSDSTKKARLKSALSKLEQK